MIDLIKVGEKTWYMKNWANVGFYLLNDTDVYIIDSGSDDESGKKITQALEERGWNLIGILNTHGHSDHYGGNAYLQERWNCDAFASASEAACINYVVLEPYLLNGAAPFEEVRRLGVWASKPSHCLEVKDPLFPSEVQVIPLPGHSPDHVGYLCPDGTLFLGDALLGISRIKKYSVQYIYEPGVFLKSAERVKSIEAKHYVSGHGGVYEDILEVADVNMKAVTDLKEFLLLCMEKPCGIDDLLEAVFEKNGMTLDYGQCTLITSIIKSYLSWLKDDGLIEMVGEGYRFLWKRKY